MKTYIKSLLRESSLPFLDFFENVYHLIPPSIRYGKTYRDMIALFGETDTWDETQFREFQSMRLSAIINQAYYHVPYYRELFDEHGIRPEEIRRTEDLIRIPVLSSDIIKSRWDDFVADNVSSYGREMSHTSGTTGPSFYFYFDKNIIPVERAQALRHLMWLGYERGDRVAVIKGQPLKESDKAFKYFFGTRELRISTAQPTDENLRKIFEALAQYRPHFIRGWPSSIYLVARWMARSNRRIKPPKCVVTSSENLYLYMKKRIEGSFQAKVVDSYGQSEFVAYALQCSHAKAYHVQMETGILELLPYKGSTCEIVGTSLWNMAMPLIRYRTGDLAIKETEPCPCGRNSDCLAEVIGRTADLVYRNEDTGEIATLSSCSFYDREEVKEAQIRIGEDKSVYIQIVPRHEITASLEALIRSEAAQCLGIPVERVIVESVEEILPTEGGKRPLILGRSPSL
jgi:phenylacetate-CoA ligase